MWPECKDTARVRVDESTYIVHNCPKRQATCEEDDCDRVCAVVGQGGTRVSQRGLGSGPGSRCSTGRVALASTARHARLARSGGHGTRAKSRLRAAKQVVTGVCMCIHGRW